MAFNFTKDGIDSNVLKQFLTEQEYDPNSMVGLTKIDLINAIREGGLEDKFAEYFNGTQTVAQDDVVTQYKEYTSNKPTQPQRGTKEWNEYVMSLFSADERVVYSTSDGKKIDAVKSEGLRRVGEIALGKVLFSGPVDEHIDNAGMKGLPCAWVKYKIVIRDWSGDIVEYQSLGDVSYLNTEDMYLGFALLTAETRAKGRAWREALGVKTYAIEEFSGKKDTAAAVSEISSADWQPAPISPAVKKTVKNLASKLKIDVYKLLNIDKTLKYDGSNIRFENLDDETLTSENGAKLVKLLNEMQQGIRPIDESILL